MATARKIIATDYSIDLKLSGAEARALSAVLRRVGGDSATTARGFIDNILLAVQNAGVKLSHDFNESLVQPSQSIYFVTGSKDKIETER